MTRREPPWAEDGLQRARALVLAHGSSANSYQLLNPGISHWFSAAGDAVVGYVEYGGFRVVAGSPVCAEERLAEVIDEFEAEVGRASLRVCYFASEQPFAARFRERRGRALLQLGAQPAWNPAHWDDSVRGHASLRAQLQRARNKGVAVRELETAESRGNVQMRRCLEEWLETRGAPPMHFLVEPQTLARLDDRRVFVAERAGSMVGFLVASPVPHRGGWLIEQIIRGRGAVNGTSELMVDTAIRAVAVGGSGYVTLGLSPLSKMGRDPQLSTPVWLRLLLGWLRAHGRRFYNFEGLDAFKGKLRPHAWEPVYAVADRAAFSPHVLHAIAGAFTDGSPMLATLRALGWALRQETRRLRRRATA